MKNTKFNKGFSFIELLIVMAVIAILAAVAGPSLTPYYRNYKYREYAYSMENLIKWGKMTAMERSVNIGICLANTKTLSIINMGTSRTNACSGATLNTLQVEDDFVSLSGNGAAFDPRGFALITGSVCISDSTKHYKAVINKFGSMRIERGTGGCS